MNEAGEIFRNHITTSLKKETLGTSGGKALEIKISIQDTNALSLTLESDERYEIYIAEESDEAVSLQ